MGKYTSTLLLIVDELKGNPSICNAVIVQKSTPLYEPLRKSHHVVWWCDGWLRLWIAHKMELES